MDHPSFRKRSSRDHPQRTALVLIRVLNELEALGVLQCAPFLSSDFSGLTPVIEISYHLQIVH